MEATPLVIRILLGAVCLSLPAVSGCRLMRQEDAARYETVAVDPTRDTQAATLHHEQALKIIERASKPKCECCPGFLCDLHRAEKLLHKALLADVRYGPAHNTLGMLYFYQHKLYLAAWEFEYAARLMPDYGEPLNNLGLVYEAADRLGRAIEHYELALEIAPQNPVYLGNLAKAHLRQGNDLEEVRGVLKEMIFYDTRPEWVAWARDTLGENPVQLASREELATGDGASELESDSDRAASDRAEPITSPPPAAEELGELGQVPLEFPGEYIPPPVNRPEAGDLPPLLDTDMTGE